MKGQYVRSNTWTPEQDEALGELLLGTITTAEAFVAAYRERTRDKVHTPGAILTKIRAVQGILRVALPGGFLAGLRAMATKKDAPVTAPPKGPARTAVDLSPGGGDLTNKYRRAAARASSQLPACDPEDAWLLASDAARLLGSTPRRIYGIARSEGIPHVAVRSDGRDVFFYLRSAVRALAERLSNQACTENEARPPVQVPGSPVQVPGSPVLPPPAPCSEDDEWITASEAAHIFHKSRWWVANNAEDMGLVTQAVRANGTVIRLYLRVSVLRAAKAIEGLQAAASEPETPEPATPEPATPEPETPEPETPEPETPEPETPEPETPEPATPEPEGSIWLTVKDASAYLGIPPNAFKAQAQALRIITRTAKAFGGTTTVYERRSLRTARERLAREKGTQPAQPAQPQTTPRTHWIDSVREQYTHDKALPDAAPASAPRKPAIDDLFAAYKTGVITEAELRAKLAAG